MQGGEPTRLASEDFETAFSTGARRCTGSHNQTSSASTAMIYMTRANCTQAQRDARLPRTKYHRNFGKNRRTSNPMCDPQSEREANFHHPKYHRNGHASELNSDACSTQTSLKSISRTTPKVTQQAHRISDPLSVPFLHESQRLVSSEFPEDYKHRVHADHLAALKRWVAHDQEIGVCVSLTLVLKY